MEISHVMNGIIFCVCSTLATPVPPIVMKWCRKEHKKMQVKKESQQNQSRWWIWSRDTSARVPNVLHRKARENQIWKSSTSELVEWAATKNRGWALAHQTTQNGTLMTSGNSEEWKSGEMLGARTVRPVVGQQSTLDTDKVVIDNDDMDSDTATESNLSLKSRSLLHRVNDRLRKILDHSSKDAVQDSGKHSVVWWMFVFDIITSICIHGKQLLRKFAFQQKYRKRSHNETDVWHIWKVDCRTIRWDIWSVSIKLWRFFMETMIFLVNDEEVLSLSHAKIHVFSDSVLCLEKVNQNQTSNTVWEEKLSWFKDIHHNTEFGTIDGEPMEFDCNIFPGFTALQPINKVQEFMTKMGDPAQFQGRSIFMSIFNDIIRGSEDNERECIANATFVTSFAKRFPAGRWTFLGLGSEKNWYSTYIDRPRGEWDRVAELIMIKFRGKRDTQFSEPRVQCPEERSKSKEVEKHQYTSVPMGIR